ncbi:hypothetical protein [Streptomyces sp. NPDC047014]|uniref:hypothetical protein n=1 Tax=Streptomyces sp. NPDC047014 TaxID=3155736 RepID=UPI0034005EE5
MRGVTIVVSALSRASVNIREDENLYVRLAGGSTEPAGAAGPEQIRVARRRRQGSGLTPSDFDGHQALIVHAR